METKTQRKLRASRRAALTKPISIRLTVEEFEQLKSEAGKISLSEFIRAQLFKTKISVMDDSLLVQEQRLTPQARQKMLAQILLKLGQLQSVNEVGELLTAIKLGLIDASPELTTSVEGLHQEIQSLRNDLLKALGLRP